MRHSIRYRMDIKLSHQIVGYSSYIYLYIYIYRRPILESHYSRYRIKIALHKFVCTHTSMMFFVPKSFGHMLFESVFVPKICRTAVPVTDSTIYLHSFTLALIATTKGDTHTSWLSLSLSHTSCSLSLLPNCND